MLKILRKGKCEFHHVVWFQLFLCFEKSEEILPSVSFEIPTLLHTSLSLFRMLTNPWSSSFFPYPSSQTFPFQPSGFQGSQRSCSVQRDHLRDAVFLACIEFPLFRGWNSFILPKRLIHSVWVNFIHYLSTETRPEPSQITKTHSLQQTEDWFTNSLKQKSTPPLIKQQ